MLKNLERISVIIYFIVYNLYVLVKALPQNTMEHVHHSSKILYACYTEPSFCKNGMGM